MCRRRGGGGGGGRGGGGGGSAVGRPPKPLREDHRGGRSERCGYVWQGESGGERGGLSERKQIAGPLREFRLFPHSCGSLFDEGGDRVEDRRNYVLCLEFRVEFCCLVECSRG